MASESRTFQASKELIGDEDIQVFLSYDTLSSTDAVEFVKDSTTGAVVLFAGTTRDSFESKTVETLAYEAHIPMALRTLTAIAKEAKEKFCNTAKHEAVKKIYICHRLGEVPVKQESVIIALSAQHRAEGWKAAEWILEEVKKRTEIWKKEKYADGSSNWKENATSGVLERSSQK